MKIPILLLVSLVSFAAASEQDEKFAALPEGQPVIAPGAFERMRMRGASGAVDPVAVEGRGFTQAVRIRTEKRPAETYQFQLRVPTVAEVKEGDKLLAIFEARVVEPQARDGAGETEFVFELAGEPHTKSISHKVELVSGWQRFYLPFEAKLTHPAGGAGVIFRAGYDPQTIEIGGVQVRNYGPDLDRGKLPYTPASYAGREANAPWRKEAAVRIDKLRKAELTILVTDSVGKPVPGAKVRARLTRHAFGFGSAVDAGTLLRQRPDGDRYRQIIVENFNKVVLENDLKWHNWIANPKQALEAVAWLRERNLEVRGHLLIWPGKKNLPKQVAELLTQPEPLRRALLDHVADEASALKGQLVEWDVVNEPFTNLDVQAALTGVARNGAPDWIERHAATLAEYFHAARAADATVKLDINDYSILSSGGKNAAHQEHYERTIRQLLVDGAPLQGIGMQGHFSEDLTPIPRLWEILDRFGKFGLPIQVTEFDINTNDEALQGDYTRDFLTAMFAHERVTGVLTWGFWENRHWIPNASLYRADWSLRPAGQAWLDLVQKEWRTDEEGITGPSGEWKVRGFLGDYDLTVSPGGSHQSSKATLMKGGTGAKVTLPIAR